MIIKLMQCDEARQPTKPLWVSILSIVGFEVTKDDITLLRFGGLAAFVKETPERIAELINEARNEKAYEQAPVESTYPPRARHTGFRDG